jgi:hypothetical protein
MKHAYSDLYIDIIDLQGEAFEVLRDILPGVDEKWFINVFMRSRTRMLLDEANPFWANCDPGQLITRFMDDEFGFGASYKKGATWGGFIPYWAGRIYAYYQWYYNVKSSWLIEILTLEDIERIFPALHQCGDLVAIEKIHEIINDELKYRNKK